MLTIQIARRLRRSAYLQRVYSRKVELQASLQNFKRWHALAWQHFTGMILEDTFPSFLSSRATSHHVHM